MSCDGPETVGQRATPVWRYVFLGAASATPTQFEMADPRFFRIVRRAQAVALHLSLMVAGLLVERIVFAPSFGKALRWAWRYGLGAHIAAITPAFDKSCYLRQFAGTARARNIACDPVLHYAIVGWREGRVPALDFDPWHFGRRNPDRSKNLDPFLLHIESSGHSASCHESSGEAEARHWQEGKDGILTMHHARGGGSSTFLDLFEASERAAGFNVFRLRAVPRGETLGIIDDVSPGTEALHSQVFDLATGLPELAEWCRTQRITRLVINHVIDRPIEVLSWIRNLSQLAECSYEVILHDYYALCPRVNMITGLSEFCGAAPPEKCLPCTTRHGSDVQNLDARTWRRDFLEFLGGASRVIVPSADMAARFRGHLPSKQISIWKPEVDDLPRPERKPLLAADEPLRVLSIGALNVPKGANVLAMLASRAAAEAAPVAFTLIGIAAGLERLQKSGVRTTGFYRPEDLGRLIEAADPHVVFFPSIWPETWSFVLTAALRRGLPVVAFDIGAPAERLRELGRGHLLPLEFAFNSPGLLGVFRDLREQYIVR